MRAPGLLLYCCLFTLPASAMVEAGGFTFPGDEMSSAAPAGGLVASYKPSDEGPARFIVTEKDEEVAGFEFLRAVDGKWRDGAGTLFVNNHIGSNTSDCLVLTAADGKKTFTSVRGLLDREGSIAKESAWIKPAQLAPDAEYHLTCERWEDDGHIDLVITGNTGIEAFKYHLRVDLAAGSFTFVK